MALLTAAVPGLMSKYVGPRSCCAYAEPANSAPPSPTIIICMQILFWNFMFPSASPLNSWDVGNDCNSTAKPSRSEATEQRHQVPDRLQLNKGLLSRRLTDSRANSLFQDSRLSHLIHLHLLAPADQIAIRGSMFLFQLEGSPARAISPVQLDDGSAPSGQEQQLRTDELLYLHPESLAALPQSARLDRALSTLLKISTAIGSIPDVDSLQWQLLRLILHVIPAAHGATLP